MGDKSNCLQFIFSIPKSWSTFRDFWSIESAEDQPSLSKHETYLSVIMTPEFKEMQDDLWEILPTDATAGSQLYNLQVNPEDLHLWSRSSSANIKMNLRHWKVLYLLRSFDFPSAGSDKRRSGGASIVIKIWPRPRWRHVSFTFQFSERHQSSLSKSMLYPTFSRFSPLRGSFLFWILQPRTKKLQQQINSDLRWQLRSLTFLHRIMCNTPQREQL